MEALEEDPHAARIFAGPADRSRKAGNRNVTWLQAWRLIQNPSREYLRSPLWSRRGPCDPQRCVAAIRFPTLDLSSWIIEWGLSCKGCRNGPQNDDESRDWEVMHSKNGYLAHSECK